MRPSQFPFFLCLSLVCLVFGCQRDADPVRVDGGPPASAPHASASAAPISSLVEPPTSAAPIAPPLRPEDVTAVIVWQKDEKAKGGFRSQWVENALPKAAVVGERPGLVAVSSTSAWILGSTIVKGCSQLAHDTDGQVVVRNDQPVRENPRMEMPELVRVSDGKRVAPWKDGNGYPMRGTQCESTLEDYGVRVQFEGGMGPFVVASVNTYEFHGGAHGVRGQEFLTIDLETGAVVKLAAPEQDRPALAKAAAKGLGAEPKDVSPSGVVLVYGPLGAGLALYRFTSSASYAGGSGGNSYSDDFVVTSKNLPAEVAAHRSLPAWVVPFLNGKSLHVFMVPPAQMALVKKQFDGAY